MKKKSSTAHASMKVHCFVGLSSTSYHFGAIFRRVYPMAETWISHNCSISVNSELFSPICTWENCSPPEQILLESGKCLALWGAPIHTLTPYTCRSKCMLEFTKAANVYTSQIRYRQLATGTVFTWSQVFICNQHFKTPIIMSSCACAGNLLHCIPKHTAHPLGSKSISNNNPTIITSWCARLWFSKQYRSNLSILMNFGDGQKRLSGTDFASISGL